MKKPITLLLFIFLFITISWSAEKSPELLNKQIPIIDNFLKNEKNNKHLENIINEINYIDSVYSNLYEKLKNNGKITIFIDPAHGRLLNGEWQGGAATHRLSCTNKPEEFYSIPLSRNLYKLLMANKYIDVKSTDDFMKVLKGESDEYKDISFTTTVKLARQSGAFMIVSEHLNNVSIIYKATGLSNIPGYHIIYDIYGRKFLKYISDSFAGFLTLYNKCDTSGFSKSYAVKIKEKHTGNGIRANGWNYGAVGDSRFTYFYDFPISVIYESGFVSNPVDEKLLLDPSHQQKITRGQYEAFLENLKEVFNVDISGSEVVKNKDTAVIDILKLARIAVYFIKNCETRKAVSAINAMNKIEGAAQFSEYIGFFNVIKNKIAKSESLHQKGLSLRKKKSNKKAARFFYEARRMVQYEPILQYYNMKYYRENYHKNIRTGGSDNSGPYSLSKLYRHDPDCNEIKKASLVTPFILPVEDVKDIKKAVYKALEPDGASLNRIAESLKSARAVSFVKTKKYSKKLKKNIYLKEKKTFKIDFTKGIYVIKLNKNLKVVEARKVGSIHLDPYKYQNQQYLKNSYFAQGEKDKAL